MRTHLFEIIAFLWLTILLSGCATSLKDMSFHANVDYDDNGLKEEIGIDGKL